MTHVRLSINPTGRSILEVDGHDISNAVTGLSVTWPGASTSHARLEILADVDHLDADLRDVVINLERANEADHAG